MPLAVALTVVGRLPFVARPLGGDEGGYLQVGQQWHTGGSSLYGNYWVDRPPLLVSIFGLAADLGGVVPLRIIGCVAAVLVVCGSTLVARQIAGRGAGRWAAAAAAIFLLSPMNGGFEVNGELLAAPFIVAGVAAVLAALNGTRLRPTGSSLRPIGSAAVAGGCLVCAVMVKQNMADVAVFAAVALVASLRQRSITRAQLVRLVLGFAAGALLVLVALAAWTLLHGTSLAGVYYAMYPFRVDAGRIMATTNHDAAHVRLLTLAFSAVASGLVVVVALAARALMTRRLREPAVWALLATVAFDLVSIAVGDSYWSHYLVQLIAPAAVLAGVLVARHVDTARLVVGAAALTAVLAWAVVAVTPQVSPTGNVGAAVGAVAKPGDTVVTMFGHAQAGEASGLSSPYPYLWWLPARTLDPQLSKLHSVLSGPSAPTWLVAWTTYVPWGTSGPNVRADVAGRYRPVARLCGQRVYLRVGVDRPTPHLAAPCPGAGTKSSATKEQRR